MERLEPTSSRIVLHFPRLSVAVLAVSRVDSVPYPPAHSRASSISLPAISADATRWSGAAGRGTVRGCPGVHPGRFGEHNARNVPCPKPAVCPTLRRTAGPARSHHMRSARTRRVGRAWRGGAELWCWVIACGRGPPPRARTSCPGCTCASSCCTTHGPEARACWGRRATGGAPAACGARSTSRRGRCVTHWRSDGTRPPGAGAPAREGVLLGCSKGG